MRSAVAADGTGPQRDSGKTTQNGRAMNDQAPRAQIHPPVADTDGFATAVRPY